ncbi:hypothetical protein CGX12_04120 [Zobellella denitrificans]|jgi:uncharacterized protein|uniref:DUF1853 family protein n=1 Tax=Zobellella denitrificans TaxID=347534 RepID=UPI000B8BD66C|nr:DUF1853 family protein [Zobellella denitrificans]OXS16350.1 hypothetical protein CGX12_04120 [Zobellella denitrificans]
MGDSLPRLLARLRDPVVRDLAWALASPNLLAATPLAPGNDWYRTLLGQYQSRLLALDAAPGILHAHCRPYRRLGQYFEALWRFFLLDHDRFQLLAYDWQQVVAGTTLGAFDFIVWDKQLQRIEHWEVAVKFYLITNPGTACGDARGVNPRDRLRHKLEHMLHHQLRLSQHPQVGERLHRLGLMPDNHRLILKGRLYYPRSCRLFLCEQGERGQWGTELPDPSFEPQQKLGWLTGGRHCERLASRQNYRSGNGDWYIRVDREWLDSQG